ncbi:MAG TPA: EamA family transporter [Ferruginibacter sp.]|nr:EamA family transporter [Ferruginibacter sp.]
MIFLIGSILLSSFLTIAFKLCDRFGISKFQAIVFNYLVCAITGSIVTLSWPSYAYNSTQPWFKWAVLMGTSFIITFYLIALTVEKSGLAKASVASKLSLIIPFLFSLFLYNEAASFLKVAGVVLALVAVVLTLFPGRLERLNNNPVTGSSGIQKIILPVIVFIGTGLLDTLIKYIEQQFITEGSKDPYLITCFSVAFVIGFLFLLLQLGTGKIVFQPKSVLAGFMIGIPNYFSIWCLLKVLKQYGDISSVIIPVNNMGIVLFSALVAWIFFKEKLTRTNWMGIMLAVLSILMIALGQ